MSGPSSSAQSRTQLILVVEDDEDLRRMLERMLSSTGTVKTAGDGQAALDLINGGFTPDIIITDVMMPRMDGLSLVKHLKADPKTAKIPVLVLTAKTGTRDVISGINAGARHYLTKPFTADDLIGKVKKVLITR